LECFTGDVEGKIFTVDNAFHKVNVFGGNLLTVVHNKDATNIKLDIVVLLLGLKEVLQNTSSSLPKAECDITLSMFVPHDIRDRHLLSIIGCLS
jgi:hypothetical protein